MGQTEPDADLPFRDGDGRLAPQGDIRPTGCAAHRPSTAPPEVSTTTANAANVSGCGPLCYGGAMRRSGFESLHQTGHSARMARSERDGRPREGSPRGILGRRVDSEAKLAIIIVALRVSTAKKEQHQFRLLLGAHKLILGVGSIVAAYHSRCVNDLIGAGLLQIKGPTSE